MTKNVSRDLFQPRKHYAGTRFAQGRVLLDSDFNEGARLTEARQRAVALDLVGPHSTLDQGFSVGQPWPEGDRPSQTSPLRAGQELTPQTVRLAGEDRAILPVTLRKGSSFVGGERYFLARSEHVAFQRDFLQMKASDLPAAQVEGAFRHLYYLHTWEQLVGAEEDVELEEPWFRGASPSVRVRKMRRVELFDGVQETDVSCELAFQRLLSERYSESAGHRFNPRTQELESTGRLQLSFARGRSADPCAPPEPNVRRYLGLGNVTLHILLSQRDRFVWTTSEPKLFRVLVRGLGSPEGEVSVELLDEPENDEQLPLRHRVVELLPFGALLEGGNLPAVEWSPHARKVADEVGIFARVSGDYDRDTARFPVDAPNLLTELGGLAREWDEAHPDADLLNTTELPPDVIPLYARLWHFAESEQDIELPCSSELEGEGLGETGVIPLFHSSGRRGDYWIAALRGDTPTWVIPQDLRTQSEGVPPHGPLRRLAPIGVVSGQDLEVTRSVDCRPRIRRATESGCVTTTVGDGVLSIGDHLSVQAAIDSLPSEGGRITVRPGIYRERIRILGRRNVILQGCGESSVIEAPLSSPLATVLEVNQSEGITITGFRMHSIDQRALFAQSVIDLSLSSIGFFSGVRENGAFTVRATNVNAPLVELRAVSAAQIRGCSFETAQRPGLWIGRSEVVNCLALDLRGGREQGPEARQPLLCIDSSALVQVQDSRILGFAQVGLAVRGTRSQDVELSDLRVEGHEHSYQGAVYEARSPVDLEDGARLSLLRSQIWMDGSPSDHAAIVVHGEDIQLVGNRVFVAERALNPNATNSSVGAWAFGGVQIRGDSLGIELLRNQIVGGVGHGITLGSVLFRPASSPLASPTGRARQNASARQGAGRGQVIFDDQNLVLDQDVAQGFSDVDGEDYLPVNEGALEDLTILDNRIEEMQGSGISVLTVLGLSQRGGELIEVRRCLIEGNTIRGNLRRPGPTLPLASTIFPFPASTVDGNVSVPVLVWGGIVLSSASDGIDIRNNAIENNAVAVEEQDSTLISPVCGVFVLLGDGVNIEGNRVTHNGRMAPRAEFPSPPEPPSVRALLPGIRAGIAVLLAGAPNAQRMNQVSPLLSGSRLPPTSASSLRVANNTVLQPEGRALLAVGTGPMAIEGNFFSSLGFHGSNQNQDRFAVGDVVFVQNLGKPWEALGIRAKDLNLNPAASPPAPYPPGKEQGFVRFNAPESAARYLLNTAPNSPRLFVGEGGQLLFTNNQVTYDFEVKRLPVGRTPAPLGFFTAALFGLDQVTVTGNQFGFRLRRSSELGSPPPADTVLTGFQGDYFAQVFVSGGMVQVSRNRCASGLKISKLSLLAYGELATSVSLNQCTHEYMALLQYQDPSITPTPTNGGVLFTDKYNIVLDPQQPPQNTSSSSDWEQSLPPVQSVPISSATLRSFKLSIESRFVRLLRRGFRVWRETSP